MSDTVESALNRLLQAVSEGSPENALDTADVKEWLAEYLEAHNEECERFPEEKGTDHWDLIMADFDSTVGAVFLTAVFQPDVVHIAGGQGVAAEVRDFGDDSFPDTAAEVIPELKRRFGLRGDVLRLDTPVFLEWLTQA